MIILMGTKPGYPRKKTGQKHLSTPLYGHCFILPVIVLDYQWQYKHTDNDRTTTMYFLSKQHVYLNRGINQDNFSSGISFIIVGDVGLADEP